MCTRGQPGGFGINPKVFFAVVSNFNQLCIKTLNSSINIKGSAKGGSVGMKKMMNPVTSAVAAVLLSR